MPRSDRPCVFQFSVRRRSNSLVVFFGESDKVNKLKQIVSVGIEVSEHLHHDFPRIFEAQLFHSVSEVTESNRPSILRVEITENAGNQVEFLKGLRS